MKAIPEVYLRMVRVGVLASPLLVWALWVWSPLGFLGSLLLVFLLEVLPVLGLAQLPLASDEEPLPRVGVYLTSGATILLLGWIGLLVGTGELGRGGMGLEWARPAHLVLWTGVATVSLLALQFLFFLARVQLGFQEAPLLHQLLPRRPLEKVLFGLLSLAAGVGEEIAFRGFAVPALVLLTGSGGAAALISSAAFGALHGYQGWLGIARTGSMGLLLAGVFLISGNLWPAILAHAILNLISGLILADTLLRER